jgi:hypothetical protein
VRVDGKGRDGMVLDHGFVKEACEGDGQGLMCMSSRSLFRLVYINVWVSEVGHMSYGRGMDSTRVHDLMTRKAMQSMNECFRILHFLHYLSWARSLLSSQLMILFDDAQTEESFCAQDEDSLNHHRPCLLPPLPSPCPIVRPHWPV